MIFWHLIFTGLFCVFLSHNYIVIKFIINQIDLQLLVFSQQLVHSAMKKKIKDSDGTPYQKGKLDFSLANDSIHSFGRLDRSFNNSIRDDSKQSNVLTDQILKSLNFSTHQTGSFYRQHNQAEQLCCKSYFTQNEVISEPESSKYEFKGYKFPLSSQKNEQIKKTICSFLNYRGGFIFIGITENVVTKQHRAIGDTYNEAQKEQILKYLRKNSNCIEPEITLNKKMEICFVPVKFGFYPYSFIPGRFIVKIKVYPGSKEQIYTVRCEEGEVYVCMRTQNQVLTYDPKKCFRKMLGIQKERLKQNTDLSNSFYQHYCRKPEQGIRIFSNKNRMLSKQAKNKILKSIQKQQGLPQKKIVRLTHKNSQKSVSSDSNEETNDRFSQEEKNEKKQKIRILNQSCQKSNSDQSLTKRNMSINNQKRKNKKSRKKAKKLSLQKQKQRQKQKKQLQKKCPNRQICIESKKSVEQSKTKQRQISFSCERVVQRYYSTIKQSKQSVPNMNKTENRSKSCKIQQVENKKLQKLLQEDKNKGKNQIDCKSSYSNKKWGKQSMKKLLLLQKYIINFNRSQSEQLDFIGQMLNINHLSHKMFAFSGFAKTRTQTIKRQLLKIGEDDYLQFPNLLIYRFSKNSNDNVLKQAISKSIKMNCKQSMIEQIQYPNTNAKKKKLNMSFQYQQQNSQDFGCNNGVKSYRIVFKMTNKIKIMNYSSLSDKIRQKIKQVCLLVQKVSQKKKFTQTIFWEQENKGEIPKIKNIIFSNVYYSLLAYLELQKLNLSLLFY